MTLGCKVNSYETEAVWELLEKEHYQRVDFQDIADVYIINTCTVTNTGENKSKKMIRQAIHKNPNAVVVVMGCYSQLKAEEARSIEGVSIVVGTNHRDQIPSLIKSYINTHQTIDAVENLSRDEPYDNLSIFKLAHHHRAFLKIQDGCNNFCSYCIIPYTRGRVRSKQPNRVIEEAIHLIASGYHEIVLTGIHTGGYGLDLPDYRFSDLLRDLVKLPGLSRLRISSIEITELTDDVMAIISESNVIVNHLHIPLQSGSKRILSLMNRKYSKQEFLDKLSYLRSIKPNLAITTDLIVGFPTETEDDFEEMLAFVKECQFQEIHVFPFSRRDGTPAAKMSPQVDGTIKKERVNRMLEASRQLALLYAQSNVGMIHEIICEQYKDGEWIGHAANYLKIRFKGDPELTGKLVNVQVTEAGYPECIGNIL